MRSKSSDPSENVACLVVTRFLLADTSIIIRIINNIRIVFVLKSICCRNLIDPDGIHRDFHSTKLCAQSGGSRTSQLTILRGTALDGNPNAFPLCTRRTGGRRKPARAGSLSSTKTQRSESVRRPANSLAFASPILGVLKAVLLEFCRDRLHDFTRCASDLCHKNRDRVHMRSKNVRKPAPLKM
jgi:hypothetical protein